MKVKIKDLKPNPFRDIEHYPINQEKVQSLKNSMEQTGFWDNILARNINGVIQIAYGHHRLRALIEKYNPDFEVDIPVKKLSDAIMLKMMANENEYIMGNGVSVTDETVRVTRQFLKEHPEEIKTPKPVDSRSKLITCTESCKIYYNSPEAFQVSEFLGWNEKRVYESLLRIDAIDEGELDRGAVESLPTEKAAERFRKTVKSKGLKKHQQKKLAKRLNEKESYGDNAINDALFEDDFDMMKLKREEINEREREKLIQFEDLVQEIIHRADDFSNGIRELMKFKDEFDSEIYANLFKKYILIITMDRIDKQIINFLNTYENGKEKSKLSA